MKKWEYDPFKNMSQGHQMKPALLLEEEMRVGLKRDTLPMKI
jgi:hypothetical protein